MKIPFDIKKIFFRLFINFGICLILIHVVFDKTYYYLLPLLILFGLLEIILIMLFIVSFRKNAIVLEEEIIMLNFLFFKRVITLNSIESINIERKEIVIIAQPSLKKRIYSINWIKQSDLELLKNKLSNV